jgi:hypothetical protein
MKLTRPEPPLATPSIENRPYIVEAKLDRESELPPSHLVRAHKGNTIGRISALLQYLLAPVAVACAAWLATVNLPGGNDNSEQRTPGWVHSQSATQSRQPMQWMNLDGSTQFVSSILLGDEDEDAGTALAIQQAAAAGDWNKVDQIFLMAQDIPSAKLAPGLDSPSSLHAELNSVQPNSQGLTPTSSAQLREQQPAPPTALMTPGVRQEIAKGDVRFYHVHLRDNCFNDGDIVEIMLNGQPMFLVPITNAGATLSIPVSASSATVISVRGIYDGGGGITVACRTSRGEGFVRVMEPEEVQPLGVVLP